MDFSKTSCDAASATDNSEHLTRGKAVAFAIGSVAAGIVALSFPFVLPAVRKFCLPYVPATPIQINAVVSLLRGRTGSAVDLGSGDGRVVSYSNDLVLYIWIFMLFLCRPCTLN